ncbi:MAG: 4-hydroxy-tetrahydrodipicolinate reductase, partial [Phycisphaerae bacterium]
RAASERIPILHAPNLSVGVNVMLLVTEMLAKVLDASYDVEITEAHHRFKADAPSGTALALRDAVIAGRGEFKAGKSDAPEPPAIVYGRSGETGTRPSGEIGIHSLRIGDTVGEHTVSFGALGETVRVCHTANSRDTFAAGALRAARWIVGRPAGLYSMRNVLFSDQSGI